MKRLFRLAVSTAALLGAGHAAAQVRSAKVDSIDENRVELSTLSYGLKSEDLTIGDGEFPSRLHLNRQLGAGVAQGMSDMTYGRAASTNLDITVGVPGNIPGDGWALTNDPATVRLTAGRSVREFMRQGSTFEPYDKKGGFITRAVIGDVVEYVYHSQDGHALKFQVINSSACGRTGTALGTQYIKCARVTSWQSPNGVEAQFTYTASSWTRHRGMYVENRLTGVSNNIGLSLAISHTLYNDNVQPPRRRGL